MYTRTQINYKSLFIRECASFYLHLSCFLYTSHGKSFHFIYVFAMILNSCSCTFFPFSESFYCIFYWTYSNPYPIRKTNQYCENQLNHKISTELRFHVRDQHFWKKYTEFQNDFTKMQVPAQLNIEQYAARIMRTHTWINEIHWNISAYLYTKRATLICLMHVFCQKISNYCWLWCSNHKIITSAYRSWVVVSFFSRSYEIELG